MAAREIIFPVRAPFDIHEIPVKDDFGRATGWCFSAGCLLTFHNHSSKVHSSHQSSAGSGYRKGLQAGLFSGLTSVQAFLFQRPAAFIFVLVLPLLRVADARLCFYIIEVHIFRTGTVCPRVFAGDSARVATDAFIKFMTIPICALIFKPIDLLQLADDDIQIALIPCWTVIVKAVTELGIAPIICVGLT